MRYYDIYNINFAQESVVWVKVFYYSIFIIELFSISMKNIIGIWMGIHYFFRLLLVIRTIFTIIIVKLCEHGIYFKFLASFQYLSSKFHSIYCTCIILSWRLISFIPSNTNWIVFLILSNCVHFQTIEYWFLYLTFNLY